MGLSGERVMQDCPEDEDEKKTETLRPSRGQNADATSGLPVICPRVVVKPDQLDTLGHFLPRPDSWLRRSVPWINGVLPRCIGLHKIKTKMFKSGQARDETE